MKRKAASTPLLADEIKKHKRRKLLSKDLVVPTDARKQSRLASRVVTILKSISIPLPVVVKTQYEVKYCSRTIIQRWHRIQSGLISWKHLTSNTTRRVRVDNIVCWELQREVININFSFHEETAQTDRISLQDMTGSINAYMFLCSLLKSKDVISIVYSYIDVEK